MVNKGALRCVDELIVIRVYYLKTDAVSGPMPAPQSEAPIEEVPLKRYC
jgi:hypothetical protein